MKYLGLELPFLVKNGAVHTAREITQQPEIWQKIWIDVHLQRKVLGDFLERALAEAKQIILTGAGTSAFIGHSLSGAFQRNKNIVTNAISTTDLVSHPRDYLHPELPTFMISFARSGNSPESVAAVAFTDELCAKSFHLIITCNDEGALSRYVSGRNGDHNFVFVLPKEANDQGLAMTSSYTGMLLAGILISELDKLDLNRPVVNTIANYGLKVIDYYADDLRHIAEKDFRRAVFLGSGPFHGTARESHLKLQELTDGRIICKEDSFLGFRHGPKVVIDESTLVVYLFSNNDYVAKYERDLVTSMKKGQPPLLEVGIMESVTQTLDLDFMFPFSENGTRIKEEYLTVCSAIPAQVLAFFKSLHLGLSPDTPSKTGAIARVVEGVQIYDFKGC